MTTLTELMTTSVATEYFSFKPSLVEAYTTGDCWRMACEINIQSGLPIVALGPNETYWIHVANRLPDGRILDVLGMWEEEDFVSHWDWYQPGELELFDTTLKAIDLETSEYTYPNTTKNVHRHAPQVLQQAGFSLKKNSLLSKIWNW